ncbi:MAG: hypothetical protein HMLKMBBP_00346 [Planctomycetes bacterium]|nr:hypothetical protein [Planctomycetota bacterium]
MGKGLGYIIGGLELVVGAILTFTGVLAEIGIPLMVAGAGTIAGTALTPTPPRQKNLRDSPTYGIDQFENPRGPDAHVPILYGIHRVKPVVIAESVTEAVEGVSPGDVRNTARQEFRWLGVICEGPVADVTDIEINDRPIVSKVREESLGKGNGSKKEFPFPHDRVFLGDDEAPAVEVFVDGVQKAWSKRSASAEFTVPAPPAAKTDPITGKRLPVPKLTFDLRRDDKRERILGGTVRVYIRGTGRPELEQLPREGLYRWGAQKLAAWKLRLRFKTRPPTGYTVRVTYDYLAAESLAIVQGANGVTKLVFGTAPGNGKKLTAKYRTTPFHGLRVTWRPGTLDQQPIEGFTDLEQSRNPKEQVLARNVGNTYSTDGREVDDLRVGISAPRGMIQYKDDGGTNAITVRVRVEYRKQGATTWTVLPSHSGNSFELIGERASTMRWEIGLRDELEKRSIAGDTGAADALADFDRAPYEVRVTRQTAESTDALVVDEIQFTYVTEVTREGFTYPGTALLGLRGNVGAALQGGSLRVTCVAKRGALYDPRTTDLGGARDLGSSQNAALAIRDLVTSAEGAAVERYGAGYFFTGSDFLVGTDGSLNGLVAFADFCDQWVHRPGDDATRPASATNGERRCRLNVVLDTPMSLMETVGDLAFLGYCFATLQGARWRFPLDQDGDPVFTFVDDVDPAAQNMSKFVLRLDEWGKSPTGVKGSFWSEFLDYERDELLYPVDGLPEATPLNVREVDLRGVTRETEAARMLRHLAEQARALPFPCTWEAHPGVQHVEAGDIVTVKTRVPYSTGGNATELKVRVLAGAVGRDEDGKLTVRYAGRVMDSSVYALKSVTVPVSAAPATAATASASTTTTRSAARRVTGLRARVQ